MTTTVHTSRETWTKDDLRLHYDAILEAGLTADQLAYFRRHGRFGDDIIMQSSSGSSGQQPLLLPRSREDVLDILARMTRPHRQMWGAPDRIALLGGISHAEGALKLKMDGAEVRAFELAQVDELIAFSPDYLS
ncbi:MAG: hypothetical protein HOH74_25415, partial [Gemmatimonadetes bacterium]|nr:hypothetical protein [Gemmatimonadota bacterium]